MKSLAEQLREFMDQMSEAPVAVRYDFETTIPNWEQPASEDDDTWEEEVDVGVNYSISGRHRAATYWEPAEHPELDALSVFDLATGADITSQISPEVMKSLEEQAWEDHDERSQPDPDYEYDRRRDDDY